MAGAVGQSEVAPAAAQPQESPQAQAMAVSVHRHSPRTGWDVPPDTTLDATRTLLLAFGNHRAMGDEGDQGLLSQLQAAFPQSVVLGCSGAGVVLGGTIHDDSLVVAIVRFAHAELRLASAELPRADASLAAGAAIGDQLADPRLRAVLILAPGVGINGSDLARGLNDRLDTNQVLVTGGLAGDDGEFSSTWVMARGSGQAGAVPLARFVAAVGLYGEHVVASHGSRGGWSIFGPERRITRSSGNVLYELDDRPALDLYKSYLGDLAAGLPATAMRFPLAVRESVGHEDYLVRTVLGVDETTRSMEFAGDIPLGWTAQLMWANFDQIVEGAETAARACMSGPPPPAEGQLLALAISCVGRRMYLASDTEAELEAALSALPAGTVQVGFYSNGELAPQQSGPCELHNQTMTITLLGESARP